MRTFSLLTMALLTSVSTFGQFSDRWVLPQDTDPAIDDWLERHYVCVNRGVVQRDLLFVFFPGSNAIPADYELVVREAANAGFHAVGLRYPNSWSINFDLCGESDDPDCHGDARFEILEGIDTSLLPEIDISYANCIRNRLVRALQYLDGQYPDEGWGQYLEVEEPRWSRIAAAGHSQGGGHAAYVAKWYDVWRVMMFAGGTDLFFGQPDPYAPWLDEHVTPSVDYFGFTHLQDAAPAYIGAWEILGLREFGDPVLVDALAPPYGRSHMLVTLAAPGVPSGYHNTIVADDYLVLDDDGDPIYAPVWRYMLNVTIPAGNTDADTDVDLVDAARLQAAFGDCVDDPEFDAVADVNFSGCVHSADAMLMLASMNGPDTD